MSNPALNYSMFAASKQLVLDNASFAFGKPLGSSYDLGYTDTTYGSRGIGILAIRTMLTVGDTSNGFDSAINRAGRSLYTRYWEKNSSISKFQPQDIIIYTYGGAQCVALLGWLAAIYGARNIYNASSTYNRDAVWRAMGVDPKDIGKHTTDLRGYINNKIIDLKNVRLDASVPLFLIADNMYKHVYMDSPNTSKTQYYVTRPGSVLKYVSKTENIGSLEYVHDIDSVTPNLTYAQLTAFVDGIFSAFFNSAYIADISAAIGKAGVKLYSVSEVSENYDTKPYFDARALMRYKNASVRPILWEASDEFITQDVINQTVKCDLFANPVEKVAEETIETSVLEGFLTGGQFLHAWSDKTETPEESIVTGSFMTNGTYTTKEVDEDHAYVGVQLKQYGYEIITAMDIFSRTGDGTLGVARAWYFYVIGEMVNKDSLANALRAGTAAKEFEFMPTVRFMSYNGGDVEINAIATIVDTDEYCVLYKQDLLKLHRTAIYAALGVPAE